MKYVGDFTPAKTVLVRFNTHEADGTPITLAGTPAVSVYKNSTTQSTAGVTLTVDYDSLTGLHHVAIDTSADGTFYAAGNDFDVVLTAGTVDAISVVGTTVGSFSLSNRSALRPATADRTIDVDASGKTLLQDGAITATVIATGAIDADALATDAVTEIAAAFGTVADFWDSLLADMDTVGSVGKAFQDAFAGTTPIPADVTKFGGTPGTFSSGRPEVNSTHFAGTAFASAVFPANVIQISGDSTAADNCELAFDGTGYGFTACTMPTVTTLTNKTGFALVSTGLDLVLCAGVSVPTALKRIGAAVSGEVSGAGTSSELFNDWTDTLCFTVTADASGNRSAVTFA